MKWYHMISKAFQRDSVDGLETVQEKEVNDVFLS